MKRLLLFAALLIALPLCALPPDEGVTTCRPGYVQTPAGCCQCWSVAGETVCGCAGNQECILWDGWRCQPREI